MIFQEDLFPCFSIIMKSREKYSPFKLTSCVSTSQNFLTTDKIMRLLSIEKPLSEHRSWSLLGKFLSLVISTFTPDSHFLLWTVKSHLLRKNTSSVRGSI